MGKAHGNCCLQCYLLGLPWRSWQDRSGAGAGRSWNSRCSQATWKVVRTSMWEIGANSSTQSLLHHLLALCPQPALPGPPTKLNCLLTPNGSLSAGKAAAALNPRREGLLGSGRPAGTLARGHSAREHPKGNLHTASLAADGYPKKLP